jgi:hypothetical protein
MFRCKLPRYQLNQTITQAELMHVSYNNGLRTMIIMVSVGMVFAMLQMAVYIVHNKRVSEGKIKAEDGEEPIIYTP